MRTAWIAVTCTALVAVSPAAATEEAPPADRIITAVNDVRGEQGLPALALSERLAESAGSFAHWQMKNDRFGHADRIMASGDWSSLGEALALRSGHRPGVHATVRRWLRSAPHAALLLSPVFTKAGAGISRGRLGRRRATIWVLQLGFP